MTKEQYVDLIKLAGGERQEVISARKGLVVDSVTHYTERGEKKWKVTTHHDDTGRMIGFERTSYDEGGGESGRTMTLIKHSELHREVKSTERDFTGKRNTYDFLPVCWMMDYELDASGVWRLSKSGPGKTEGDPVFVVADNIVPQEEGQPLARRSPERVNLELPVDRENGGYSPERPFMRWSYEVRGRSNVVDEWVEIWPEVEIVDQIRMDGKGEMSRPVEGDRIGNTPLVFDGVGSGKDGQFKVIRDIATIGNPERYAGNKETAWDGMRVMFPNKFDSLEAMLGEVAN